MYYIDVYYLKSPWSAHLKELEAMGGKSNRRKERLRTDKVGKEAAGSSREAREGGLLQNTD